MLSDNGNGNGNGLPKRVPKQRAKRGRPKNRLTTRFQGQVLGRPKAVPSGITDDTAEMIRSVIETQAGELADLILFQLRIIAGSDVRNIPGCPQGIPDSIAYAIQSFDVSRTVTINKDGSVTETEKHKYNLWSKPDAIGQLSRMIGMFRKDNEQLPDVKLLQLHQYNQVSNTSLSDEEINALRRLGMVRQHGNVLEIDIKPK